MDLQQSCSSWLSWAPSSAVARPTPFTLSHVSACRARTVRHQAPAARKQRQCHSSWHTPCDTLGRWRGRLDSRRPSPKRRHGPRDSPAAAVDRHRAVPDGGARCPPTEGVEPWGPVCSTESPFPTAPGPKGRVHRPPALPRMPVPVPRVPTAVVRWCDAAMVQVLRRPLYRPVRVE